MREGGRYYVRVIELEKCMQENLICHLRMSTTTLMYDLRETTFCRYKMPCVGCGGVMFALIWKVRDMSWAQRLQMLTKRGKYIVTNDIRIRSHIDINYTEPPRVSVCLWVSQKCCAEDTLMKILVARFNTQSAMMWCVYEKARSNIGHTRHTS